MIAASRLPRLFAIAAFLAIAGLAGCVAPPKTVAPPPPPSPAPAPTAAHPLDRDQPSFIRPANIAPGHIPVRVGIILPFNSNTAATRNLAAAMLNAAELALFDSKNRDMVLIPADEGSSPDDAAAAAQKLLSQGAEIIIGPLFAQSVTAVAPIARDRGVPVLAFSTERKVAGNGVYLLSFLPQMEVARVISYAVAQGHHNLAAMVPQNAYGDVAAAAFDQAVKATGAQSVDVEHFAANAGAPPAQAVAKSGPDAVLIAAGGATLKTIAPSLIFAGLDPTKVKLLGTGLWDDPALGKEQSLQGGWFAAPEPDADSDFGAKYKEAYGGNPPELAPLAYDAISLVALLAPGTPYHRFTPAALTDPNGFNGVNGIFRFAPDGTAERGLAVLEMTPDGVKTVSPAPRSFEKR